MIISEILEECPDCRKNYPLNENKFKVVEIYAGFEPTEINPVEKYIYFCRHCGTLIKRLRSLSPKEPDKYFKIEFINDEMKVTELQPLI
jgi:hypothetical protein